MKIIERYLSTTLLRFILLVLAIVTAVDLFIYIVGEFGDLGKGSYGIGHAFLYAVLVIPSQVYELFPMVGLLGCLIGLGLLAQHSELLVMRASGMPLWRIIKAVLQLALVVTVVITLLGETVAPTFFKWASDMKLVSTSGGQAANTRSGLWVKDKDQFAYIGQVSPNMQLTDVTIYQFNAHHQLQDALHAKHAAYLGPNDWQLQDVSESVLRAHEVVSHHVARYHLPIALHTSLIGRDEDFTSQLSLWALYVDIRAQQQAGMDAKAFELAFWQRIAQPIAALVMILLSVPFIFGPLRSVTMGLRIVTGAAAGFAFYLLNQFFGPFCLVYQIPPIIGAFLPTVIFMLFGLWLLRRVK